jgi:DNA mismatch repair protein MutS
MNASDPTLAPATAQAYQTLHSFQVDPDSATPMVRQFLEVKRQYPGVLLLYRMGDFYETFFEDALIAARALEITLTGRDAGKYGRIPMAGIPVKAAEAYLGKLMAQNLKVAICEQMEDPALAKGLVERKVVRVLSPGTVTEAAYLKSDENNFLAAIAPPTGRDKSQPGARWGLAFCDVTTGQFVATEIVWEGLLSELDRLKPTEVLVPGRLERRNPLEGVPEWVPDAPAEITSLYRCSPVPDIAYRPAEAEVLLKELFKVNSLEGFGLSEAPYALRAAGAIGFYLKETFLNQPPALDRIQRYQLEGTVNLSISARRNLELLATSREGRAEGSLYAVLNRTATAMGARLLRQWISQPITHLPELLSRQDGVEELVSDPIARTACTHLLPDVYDLERLAAKVANLSASPRDLIALKLSLQRLPALSDALSGKASFHLDRMQGFPEALQQAAGLIERALEDTPPIGLKEGGLMKAGFHAELDELRALVANHNEWLAAYEAGERERSGIRTLKVGYNNAFGYFIEVSRAQASLVPVDYHRKQTLTNAERYTTDTLKAREEAVLNAQGRLFELEYELFLAVRRQLLPYADAIKDAAHRVAVLDVLQSLAMVAVENRYVRPELDESLALEIINGRHPVLEPLLPMGQFVPNDCKLSGALPQQAVGETPQMAIITGPNMAGKSTYMRQIALIVLMAQMGSFVPASQARIGLVDAIFTRIGAVDDLSAGQSTFMVEMTETAHILNAASPRSLVILDEVGRGTSTYDGVAIAWSVAEFLATRLGCRTLFATHYHELNALESMMPGRLQNLRVCVSEAEGRIEFLHRVEPGAAQKSYGIQVARMAGLPGDVVNRAASRLAAMQKRADALVSVRRAALTDPNEAPQLSLF